MVKANLNFITGILSKVILLMEIYRAKASIIPTKANYLKDFG
jgi:hypothetical protein